MTTNAASNVSPVKDGESSKHEPVKRALFIGIVYKNRKQAANTPDSHPVNLRGPHKDCTMLSKFIQGHYGYKEKDIVMLLDTRQNMKKKKFTHLRPTRVNILREITNLVKGAKPGDSFFFHYSGHGDQVPCGPEDQEPDGMDETLVPYDAKPAKGGGYEPETLILDNDMHKLMVKDLPVGARLTAIYDMCHAGTALDLKHYECNRAVHPFWWKSLKASFETPGFAKLTRVQSTCIPDPTEPIANEDKPASSPVRVIPNRPLRRRSHYSERSIRVQPTGRNNQQEMSKTSYVEGHAIQGVERLEIRTRSMSLNPEDPSKPTETSTSTSKTTTTRPSSPSRRHPRVCRSCSLPFDQIPERTNSIAPSIASAMQNGAMVDSVAFNLSRPLAHKKDKGVLSCLRHARISWPPKIFRRRAKTMDVFSFGARHDVIKGVMSPKAASEGTYLPHPLSKRSTMTAIQENGVAEVESSISYSPLSENQRIASPEPMVCTCSNKGVMNDAGYPDVISIASCSDEQSTFEGPEGLSVTQTLIKILDNDPHPKYKDLMKEMSRSLYNQAIEMLHFYKLRKDYREGSKDHQRKASAFKGVDVKFMESVIESAKNKDEDEWEDFVVKYKPIQDPQLGSQKRLNLNDKFSP
ncbi:hypothetical protein SCHPADRAFT_907399 [Schizopora paradoxa]|uniref:Peptidase C14 caspase domain-containing protein n=1 Tax=Schizopora paradoxa TaxID=27342 RepID=A0A0H2REA3_9AGAM|nr:hypothetical protein SCHPADRAFT_907399 [Schizopora paradoxa]